MQISFINLKNKKEYFIIEFVRVKVGTAWKTAIRYGCEHSQQEFARFPEDFFEKFIPKVAWDSATPAQKGKLVTDKEDLELLRKEKEHYGESASYALVDSIEDIT